VAQFATGVLEAEPVGVAVGAPEPDADGLAVGVVCGVKFACEQPPRNAAKASAQNTACVTRRTVTGSQAKSSQ
jgi:hypothetical protein